MDKKRESFERLTKQRVGRIVDTLRLLEANSNKYVYDYTDNDITAIFAVIEEAVAECKEKFEAGGKKKHSLPW